MVQNRTLLIAVLVFALTAYSLNTAAFAAPEQSFAEVFRSEYGFGGLKSFREQASGCQLELNTGGWFIQDAGLELAFEASPLLEPESVKLEVTLNGKPVYSGLLPDSVGNKLSIPLEATDIKPNATSLVRVEAALPASESGGIWLNLLDSSRVWIDYTPETGAASISELYSRFTDAHSLNNRECAVLVPADAARQDLTAAFLAISGLSSQSPQNGDKIDFRAVESFSELSRYRYGIYIAGFDFILPEVRDKMSPVQRAAAEKNAVAALLQLDNDISLLVVTGKDPSALERAGRMFANSGFVRGLRTDTAEIRDNTSCLTKSWRELPVTALTDRREYATGAGRRELSFEIPYPTGRQVAPSSELVVELSYSPQLDFSRSTVTASIDGVPMGSKLLTEENAGHDKLTFDFPQELDINGDFTVTLEFFLAQKDAPPEAVTGDEAVQPRDEPWACVLPGSFLYILSNHRSQFSLEYFPALYLRDGKLNDVGLVMPDRPAASDLEVMRLLAVALGRRLTDNSGVARVISSGQVTGDGPANLISVGKAAVNPMLNAVPEDADAMSLRVEAGKIMANKAVLVDLARRERAGALLMLQLPQSGYARSLLIITGETDHAMLTAAGRLTTQMPEIYGNAARIDTRPAQPAPMQSRPEQPESVSMLTTEASIALFLLGAALLAVKYRRRAVHEV